MARLTGQAAREFIAANPKRKFNILKGGTPELQQIMMERNKPRGGIVGGIARSIINPFVSAGELAGEGMGYLASRMQGNRQPYQRQFLEDKENVLAKAISAGAGIGSFAIPAGAGVKGAMALGGLSGALGGLGEADWSDPESVLTDIGTGALLGGATGGILGKLAGRGGKKIVANTIDDKGIARGISGKLDNFAQGRELNAFRREVGSNAPSTLGGAVLEKQSYNLAKRYGTKIRNSDDLIKLSGQVFDEFGSKVSSDAARLTEQGVMINIDDVTRGLTRRLTKTKTPELRKPIEGALASIRQATNGKAAITPVELLNLRREWGDLGKFNPFRDTADTSLARAFEMVYGDANRVLNKTFKVAGINDFREVNKILETAIRQEKWANVASGKLRPTATANDMAQDVGRFAAAASANPLFAAPGFVIGKTIQSPAAERGLARVARRASSVVSGTGGIPGGNIIGQMSGAVTSPLARRLVPPIAGRLGTMGGDETGLPLADTVSSTEMMPEMTMQPQLSYEDYLMQAQQMLPGAKINEIMNLADRLSKNDQEMGGGGRKQTTKQSQFSNAAGSAQRALDLLESGQASSGKLQSIESKIGGFLGTTGDAQVDYKSQLALARGLAVNALAGANITPSEARRIADSIPNESDEPKIARQKLRSFIQQMTLFGGGSVEEMDPSVLAETLSNY